MQRPEFASAENRFLRLARLGKHRLRLAIDERVQLGIQALDPIEVSACHLDRGNFSPADLGCDFAGGKKSA